LLFEDKQELLTVVLTNSNLNMTRVAMLGRS
jgi:hypothetical protein